MTQNETDILQAATNEGLSADLANIMVSQAKTETGNFTSNIFKTDNNAFGYKYVGQSIKDSKGNNTVSQGSPVPSSELGGYNPNYYARYTSPYYSGVEMARWIKRNVPDYNNVKTVDEYAIALKNSKIGSYYGASVSAYTASLKKYWVKFTDFLKNNAVSDYVKKNPEKSIAVSLIASGLIFYGISLLMKKKK